VKKRTFGSTGISIGEVGLGTWQIGAEWGEVTEETALLTLKKAVSVGTNFFDTADVYGKGRSETIIGKFLKETKEKVFETA